jgi:soluble lytic murein transglycosylase-like protein
MMKKLMVAGLIATAFSVAILETPAQARNGDNAAEQFNKPARKASQTFKLSKDKAAALAGKRKPRQAAARAGARNSGHVVTLIESMAPGYGVPTWFALRIAKVESNYNPKARGAAGELGVFQLKCSTAKGIGYSGGCSGLLDARTNVAYGLKHLSLAMKSSGGNLRLAASKHNGGLGRKTVVRGYVAKVF